MRFIKVVFFILVLGAGLLWAKEARADYCGKTCVCGNYDCDCFGATEASCKAVCQDPSESVTEDNCEWVLSCGNLNQPCCFNDSCNGALVCYSGICKNACTDKCTNSEPLQCRNGDIQSNNCDKSGDCNEWDGWVTNTDCGEGFCTYDASGNPICQIPYCENGDCNDAACRDSDGGCDISEMCVECYTNSTKSNWMYDTCEFMYDCEDYEGECHPIETWCGGDASCPPASGPSANTQATIDNCGGVDCEDPASIDCGGNPGNPGCTENWQEQGCEACGCASDQMCLRDENDCGGADQCNYDASCLINPPTCSMTAGDLKPMINQSYNYTATGNAGGGNLTFLKLFETVAIDPPVPNELTGSPCTIGSCTASKSWNSLGYKYVMCNAFNDTIPQDETNSRCTGNPYKTVFDTWSDCDVADSDQMTVAVVDDKTCTVTLDNDSIEAGESVTITYSGDVNGPESDTVRVWVEKQDGSQVTLTLQPSPTTEWHNLDLDLYFYVSDNSCTIATGDITTGYDDSCANDRDQVITFPEVGEYYIHCDLEADPRRCSGNPFCTHELGIDPAVPNPPGTHNCVDWVSCSESDNVSLSVTVPVGDISGTIYDADSGLGVKGVKPGDGSFVKVITTTNQDPGYTGNVDIDGGYTVIDVPEGESYAAGLTIMDSSYVCTSINPIPLLPCIYSGTTLFTPPMDALDFYVTQIRDAWWQAEDACLHANGDVSSSVPDTADDPFLITGISGLVSYSDNLLNPSAGMINKTLDEWRVKTSHDITKTDYAYFEKLLSEDPVDFETWDGNIPDKNGVFYSDAPKDTVDSWDIPSGQSSVILVDGDVVITDNIEVESGEFLAIISSGNITIADDVTVVQGVYIADGVFRSCEIDGDGSDSKLNAQGTFVGWGGVTLCRDFEDTRNNTNPIEMFKYRPDFLLSIYKYLKKPIYSWREVAP